jgi:ATP-dependent RNA helicase DeaD
MTTEFNQFNLPAKLLQALQRVQFTTPTPIQVATIPPALEGKDVLGSAQTGTGKTAAFGIPLMAHLMLQPEAMALVMTPTRELAAQVLAALQSFNPHPDIRSALLIGGEPLPRQFRQLQQNPRLIVGTPGRINDHLARGTLKLKTVQILVLDETDRMLDMGFGVQIDEVVRHIPSQRQTLLFSATLPPAIVKLAGKYQRDPVRVAVGPVATPIAKIQQDHKNIGEAEKYPTLLGELTTREGTVIIFVKTKHGSDRLAVKLAQAGHRAVALHGGLKQNKRDRVIQEFRDQKFRVMVATDVAARGLDIPHIAHVINYDLPQCPEDYIHRIGRTARAGATGMAINLVSPADEEKWDAIHHLLQGGTGAPPQTSRRKKPGTAPWKGKSNGANRSANGNNKGGANDGKAAKPRNPFHAARSKAANSSRPKNRTAA